MRALNYSLRLGLASEYFRGFYPGKYASSGSCGSSILFYLLLAK